MLSLNESSSVQRIDSIKVEIIRFDYDVEKASCS